MRHIKMFQKIVVVLCAIVQIVLAQRNKGWGIVGNPLAFARPCDDNEDITAIFESGKPPGEENQYMVQVKENFTKNSKVNLKFDSDATVTLTDNSSARIRAYTHDQSFGVSFFKDARLLSFHVQGPQFGAVPYLTSVEVNTVEYCEKPKSGYLDSLVQGVKDRAELSTNIPDQSCGRRKVEHTELIVNGLPTKPGDWPWHTAIYRLEKSRIDYICGGTLLSKSVVLTAAHCVTSRGKVVLPETRNVILGKYHLAGGDVAPQEKEVHTIVVHENFAYSHLDNDIALLKLTTEVSFDDYVQPACIWNSNTNKRVPQGAIVGSVAGWGFDQTDSLSSTLQQVVIPVRSETTCIKSNPLFFSKLLNSNKFCAGFKNGTSACNGDSGGGFHVYIPDELNNSKTGAWYTKGIVSLSVARHDAPLCDPNEYVIFTDVAKYKGWIEKYLR